MNHYGNTTGREAMRCFAARCYYGDACVTTMPRCVRLSIVSCRGARGVHHHPNTSRQKRLHPSLIRSRILAKGRTVTAPQFGKRLGLAGGLVQPLAVREYNKHVAAAVAYQHRALDLF